MGKGRTSAQSKLLVLFSTVRAESRSNLPKAKGSRGQKPPGLLLLVIYYVVALVGRTYRINLHPS